MCEIRNTEKYFELNKMESTTNLRKAAKKRPGEGWCVAMTFYTRKGEELKINDFYFYFKKLEREKQLNKKVKVGK